MICFFLYELMVLEGWCCTFWLDCCVGQTLLDRTVECFRTA